MTSETFIGRQPILYLHTRLVGYEFLFHASGEASSLDMTNRFEASIRVVRNLFSSKDTGEFLGGKLAFINVSVELLLSGLREMLPATSVVLDLDAQVPASKEVEGGLEQLQQRGFSFGLDDFAQDAPSAGLLSWATYVTLDCQHYGPDELAEACANVSSKSKTLIAKGIETKEQTQTIARLGIKLFQGYYFARPVMLAAKVLNPAVLSLIELLRLVRADAPVRALEDILKFDPVLSFKLLRYVNSAAFGTRGEIISFPQAVAVLGYKNLYRWLSLLLVTAGSSGSADALAKTAVTRGFIAESLAQLSPAQADELFLVGAYSLLDVMFETPKEIIFDKVPLPSPVKDAIVSRTGPYAPYLDLVEACEQSDLTRLVDHASALKLSAETVNRAHINALARVEQLGVLQSM